MTDIDCSEKDLKILMKKIELKKGFIHCASECAKKIAIPSFAKKSD